MIPVAQLQDQTTAEYHYSFGLNSVEEKQQHHWSYSWAEHFRNSNMSLY